MVAGVTGCGKASVSARIAKRFQLAFVDRDDLHSRAAIAKMAGGQPLTDADRWPWKVWIGAAHSDRQHFPSGLVVACSALRKIYRHHLQAHVTRSLAFVLLDGPRELILERMTKRESGFMPPDLLDSQLALLERPVDDADVAMHRY